MSSQYGEYIGVDDVYIAEVTSDDSTSYVAGTPEYLAPAASIAMEPSVSSKTRYYDNKAYFATSTEGETKVTTSFSGLPIEMAAKLLGRHYDATKKRLYDNGDASAAPYFALGFRTEVEGGYKYFWYLKGKFSPWTEEAATRTNDIDEKTVSLEFTAVNTEHAGFDIDGTASSCKRVVGDDRVDSTLTAATWFAAVQKPDEKA